MLDTIIEYLQYPFVRRIFVAGVLVAFCASVLGVTLVLKRFSYIGDGLSHVAFGAVAIASIFNLTTEMLLVLPITVIGSFLLGNTGHLLFNYYENLL